VLAIVGAWAVLASAAPPGVDDALILSDDRPARLSAFRFFAGDRPNARVLPYRLNTPLFSDHADKDRFVYVPAGKVARFDREGRLDLPVGSALIKSFAYPAEAGAPAGARRVLETRVLLRRAEGWVALPYVWDGPDAVLKRAGARLPVRWTDQKGAVRQIDYAVPNTNQCKECHQQAGALVPIGPRARNLDDGRQIERLVAAGLVAAKPRGVRPLPRWDDPGAPVADRARAYLDVNCGHCHSRQGIASNSGLYLTWEEADPVARGRLKRPVAAGRGSGDFEFAIAPGAPDKSILLYRMASTEPGVAMPELGRSMVHEEGVALVRDYIAGMR
jgi:uncharacterized repeat protein (TIGR03806 family)